MAEQAMIKTLDEFEAEYRKGVGYRTPPLGSKVASIDNIRRFGDGVGDYNPLYRDEAYGAKSRFGMVTAPPIFIYGASIGVAMAINGNIDGRRLSSSYFPMNYAGGTIDFHRTIWPGDRVTATEEIVDVHRKHSDRIGDFVLCEALVSYHNQRKELVATKQTLMARYENLGGGRTIAYDREKKTQVVEESPDPLVFERERRGSQLRHFEDVVEGEAVPTLHKGTYTVTELFLFTHGVVGTGRSPRAALEKEESKDLGGGGRFDADHARHRRNMPGQFDWGPQRVCWLAQMATDWMGDDGTLKRMVTRVRHPNVVGDTNTVFGKVGRKYIENGENLVDLEVYNENQAGLATAESTITVALPGRGA
ncbi:MAG: MaoC family dehydratase N-terminal domain-containing protein [Gammaproteobacteria bacterium]|nr:MaoC family dehydratase N-terminal domain-containing protein [Gammaproteobacteria bacterium]